MGLLVQLLSRQRSLVILAVRVVSPILLCSGKYVRGAPVRFTNHLLVLTHDLVEDGTLLLDHCQMQLLDACLTLRTDGQLSGSIGVQNLGRLLLDDPEVLQHVALGQVP